ncbi:MAG: hypothetical protein ACHREM_12065 [Polyangiales bacterium]
MRTLDRFVRLFISLSAALVVALLSANANAYPWMIRHGYANCGTCHTDPSGSGLLTEYGHSQSDILLSTHYGAADAEPGHFSDSLFGLMPESETFLVGGWVRDGYYAAFTNDPVKGWNKADSRILQMRADLAAQATFGSLRLYASLGALDASSSSFYPRALVTDGSGWNAVAREYWAGLNLAEGDALLRVGRLILPIGIRIPEHTSFARTLTRSDFNDNQQHGIAFAYHHGDWRAEVMAVLGNFQVGPDKFRDRGYAGYAEWHLDKKYAVGVSSSVLHASTDLELGAGATRHVHGLFARGSPFKSLAILVEADALINAIDGVGTKTGYVGFAQADEEFYSGIHALLTAEVQAPAQPNAVTTTRIWLGAQWFPIAHFDVRADAIYQPAVSTTPAQIIFVGQGNAYL